MKNELTNDVIEFNRRCSDMVGIFENDMFNQNNFCECLDLGMDSPIEHLFYIALKTLMKVNFMKQADPVAVDGKCYLIGAGIFPQRVIGKYRVDFHLCYQSSTKAPLKELVVECDGHEFHDRDEKQRRYEKARERYLQSQGYHIFRYTGSEIKKNPFRVAAEAISYLTGWKIDDIIDPNYIQE